MNVVAVTGAGGMIGRHLVDVLKPSVREVRVLLLPNEPVPVCCDNTVIHRGDIRRSEDLRCFLDGANTVFHLAALVGKDADVFAEAHAVNVEGTNNLLDMANVSGVGRFVLLSTCCAYGLYSTNNELVDEGWPHSPVDHPYDRTKTESEEQLTAHDPAQLPWSVLQVPIVLGGAHTINKPNLMAHIRLTRSGYIPVALGGKVWANFVYAEDVALALACLGEHPLAVGEVFILNEAMPLDDLLSLVERELGTTARRVSVPYFALRIAARAQKRFAVLANRRRFSSDKLHSRLGFAPRIGLEEGVRATIAHYRKTGLIT